MSANSPPPALNGVLVLDKPAGITSMRAVEIVRRRAGGVRAGHAGTLDPLATGVLLIALGAATKQIATLMAGTKRYETEIDLSATTATLDAEAARVEVPVESPPSEATVRQALRAFVGSIQQRPPAFSAIKLGGQRAWRLARRAGGTRDAAAAAAATAAIEPRIVRVHSLELDSFVWPLVRLRVHSDKGFYVRSLARDLGAALATGGYCTLIRRTAVGPFTLDQARSLESLGSVGPTDLLSVPPAASPES